MSASLRTAVIGYGGMGRNHARVLASHPDVASVVAADPQQYDKVPRGGLVTAVRDVRQAVEQGLDLAIVATPPEHHREVALILAASGVPTLIEKPLAPTRDEAEEIVNAFESRAVLGAVGHIERYNSALVELRRRLRRGEVGEAVLLATTRHGPRPSRERSVGVGLDLATHDLDIGRWLLDCRYTAPSAAAYPADEGALEDLICILAYAPSGAVVSHSVNWISTHKQRTVTLVGKEGTLTADLLSLSLTRSVPPAETSQWDDFVRLSGTGPGEATRYEFARSEPLVEEIGAFIKATLGSDADIVSLRDGLAAVSAAENVIGASRSSRS